MNNTNDLCVQFDNLLKKAIAKKGYILLRDNVVDVNYRGCKNCFWSMIAYKYRWNTESVVEFAEYLVNEIRPELACLGYKAEVSPVGEIVINKIS